MNTYSKLLTAGLVLSVSECALAQVDPASDPLIQPLAGDLKSSYQLVWSDEFSGSELDEGKWEYRTDSKLWSTQLPENVSVSGGHARISLKKEKAGDKQYTGGGIISKDYFRYGFYEARVKVPSGEGWHTSFWMMDNHHENSDTSQLELDPLENDSVDLNRYSVDFHQWRSDKGHFKRFVYIYPEEKLDEFHVYGMEFTPGEARYYFDGELVQVTTTIPQRHPPEDGSETEVRAIKDVEHNDVNIWFTSIAGKLAETTRVDDSMLPSEAACDYVRFFEAEN